jgi:hypothetical protein
MNAWYTPKNAPALLKGNSAVADNSFPEGSSMKGQWPGKGNLALEDISREHACLPNYVLWKGLEQIVQAQVVCPLIDILEPIHATNPQLYSQGYLLIYNMPRQHYPNHIVTMNR